MLELRRLHDVKQRDMPARVARAQRSEPRRDFGVAVVRNADEEGDLPGDMGRARFGRSACSVMAFRSLPRPQPLRKAKLPTHPATSANAIAMTP